MTSTHGCPDKTLGAVQASISREDQYPHFRIITKDVKITPAIVKKPKLLNNLAKIGIMEIDKKKEFGWAMFDWANSSYNLVISTALFPPYFIAITSDRINIFGLDISNSATYTFAVSIAYAIVILCAPILSGLADYGGNKRPFLKFFTTLGAIACMSLIFFDSAEAVWFGLGAFVVATVGHAGSLVFYDAYLPEVTTPERYNRVSARGYALGYIGSVILLLFNLALISFPDTFGLESKSQAIRISLLSVGVWWLCFAQVTFYYLPRPANARIRWRIKPSVQRLRDAINITVKDRDIAKFLMAFFCYSAGVQTVVYVATLFAKKELNFPETELIIVVLLLQIVAIGGAYLFSYLSKIMNNFNGLMIALITWIGICIAAYFVHNKFPFYVIAGCVGMVIGGIQALSRSTFSRIIPREEYNRTCLFSLYNVFFYGSVIIGPFLFGLIETLTGSMRNSVIALIIFFLLGLLFIFRIPRRALYKYTTA